MRVLTTALGAARERLGARLTQFTIQPNHIHLILEAEDSHSLSRAMQGLCVLIARQLNRAFGRKGAVFADRFHAHVLRTPREVKNAVRYVMENSRRHAERRGETWYRKVDPFAGGPCPTRFHPSCRDLVAEPRSILLCKAWDLPYQRRSIAPPPAQLRICEPTGHVSFDALPLGRVHELAKRRRGRSACGSRTVLA